MKDRIPQYPGRVKLLHVKGDIYDLTRADEAVEVGTPLNKSTLLTDETAVALGLEPSADPTVNDAFLQTQVNMAAVEGKIPSEAKIQQLIDGGVTEHNQSAIAHSDIRTSLTDTKNALQNDISSAKVALQANIDAVEGKIPSNAAIQQLINSGVVTHNQEPSAHSDIRASITNIQSTLQSNINSTQSTLQTNINNVNSSLTSKVDTVNTNLTNSINWVYSDLLTRINAADATLSGMTKCQFGTYVGTGVYGQADANRSTLTFQFAPAILLIGAVWSSRSTFYLVKGEAGFSDQIYYYERIGLDYAPNWYSYFSWSSDGKTVTWGANYSAEIQLNMANYTYFYIALA